MITFIFWVITIFLVLAVIGGIMQLSTKGFKVSEFIGLLVVMAMLVVFATIAITGQFVIK